MELFTGAAGPRSSGPASTNPGARSSLATWDPDRLGLTVQDMVHELHTLHRGVVHVADLVQPGAEPTAREDVVRAKPRLDRAEAGVPSDRRNRIRHVGRAAPRCRDPTAVGFLHQPCFDQALDHTFD